MLSSTLCALSTLTALKCCPLLDRLICSRVMCELLLHSFLCGYRKCSIYRIERSDIFEPLDSLFWAIQHPVRVSHPVSVAGHRERRRSAPTFREGSIQVQVRHDRTDTLMQSKIIVSKYSNIAFASYHHALPISKKRNTCLYPHLRPTA